MLIPLEIEKFYSEPLRGHKRFRIREGLQLKILKIIFEKSIKTFLVIILISLETTCLAQANNVSGITLNSALPRAGTSISFIYTGKLRTKKALSAVLYYFTNNDMLQKQPKIALLYYFANDNLYAGTVKLSKSKNINGTFYLPDSATAFCLVFKSGENADSNNTDNYIFAVYKNNKPLKGSLYHSSLFYMPETTYLLELSPDVEKALRLKEQEFKAYPVNRTKYKLPYLYNLSLTYKRDVVKREISQAFNYHLARSSSEDTLKMIESIFSNIYGKTAADSIDRLIIKRFPSGETAIVVELRTLFNPTNLACLAKWVELETKYPNADFSKGLLGIYSRDFFTIALDAFIRATNIEKFSKYIQYNPDKKRAADQYNSIAQQIFSKTGDISLAKEFSNKSIELIELLRNERPVYRTEMQWNNELSKSLAFYKNTYAFLLSKEGKRRDALAVQKEAISLNTNQPKINEQYLQFLLEEGRIADAKTLAESFVTTGKYNDAIRLLLKTIYLKENGDEKQFDKYFAGLSETGNKKILEELEAPMVRFPAKQFVLKDMDGVTVSLDSLKGKVVVLDFWANWCRPCIESFKGMEMVTEKYRKDEKVVLLFINTNEDTTLDVRKKRTKALMQAHKYNFRVLFDEKSVHNRFKMDTEYSPGGMPAKFVIDGNARIRFKEIGYDGDPEELAQKLCAMIELAKRPNL